MILFLAQCITILFGVFIILVGFLMLFSPEQARSTLRKAGSTDFINYAEITLRLIPATSLIICSDFSKFPLEFKILGWFMMLTSFILYFVPRKLHHKFSVKSANLLLPIHVRLISPFSLLFGGYLIFCTL